MTLPEKGMLRAQHECGTKTFNVLARSFLSSFKHIKEIVAYHGTLDLTLLIDHQTSCFSYDCFHKYPSLVHVGIS